MRIGRFAEKKLIKIRLKYVIDSILFFEKNNLCYLYSFASLQFVMQHY